MNQSVEDELEFAYRQYTVATDYLLDVFAKYENVADMVVSASIRNALCELADAINEEWG